ncbi:hypothetical protein PV10_06207 [Exophiala mesophila]|uniref:Uncharacterized protein n=1 Tax=Exophiala mesophila TaxID=212818 RepID=A0A0D1ZXV3_EXOME|nr:uncharacterized protein PV10_06207 [Exophiala mesophila]KIV91693.1 hypothetical protein PV10_06207 [Exophiala mesophila]
MDPDSQARPHPCLSPRTYSTGNYAPTRINEPQALVPRITASTETYITWLISRSCYQPSDNRDHHESSAHTPHPSLDPRSTGLRLAGTNIDNDGLEEATSLGTGVIFKPRSSHLL